MEALNCNLSQSVQKWETLRVEFRHNTEVSIDLWSWSEDVPGPPCFQLEKH